MKLSYRFRDRDDNVAETTSHRVANFDPTDFSKLLSVGSSFASLSDGELIKAALTYELVPGPSIAGPQSDVNRLGLLCCFLENGDATVIIIPSIRTDIFTVDENGTPLPVVAMDSMVMDDVQAFTIDGVDEYGIPIDRVHIIGLAR